MLFLSTRAFAHDPGFYEKGDFIHEFILFHVDVRIPKFDQDAALPFLTGFYDALPRPKETLMEVYHPSYRNILLPLCIEKIFPRKGLDVRRLGVTICRAFIAEEKRKELYVERLRARYGDKEKSCTFNVRIKGYRTPLPAGRDTELKGRIFLGAGGDLRPRLLHVLREIKITTSIPAYAEHLLELEC